jgi:hypothetical protein
MDGRELWHIKGLEYRKVAEGVLYDKAVELLYVQPELCIFL